MSALDWFSIDLHFRVMETCESNWRGFRLPMATPEGQRYPYVYPRDLAAIARAFDRIGTGGPNARHMRESLRGAAEFIIASQSLDGTWGQRYSLAATDRSIYHQEDNTAHAVAVLARHVRRERRESEPSPIEEKALDAIRRGLAAAKASVYRKGINLFFSTTSIHESTMERGYTLWTNGAYRDAFRLGVQAAEEAGRDDLAKPWNDLRERLDENIARHFIQDGQWIRALTPTGRFDRRPDVTLLSPYYFLFEHLDPAAADASAERIEEELWDPDLGLLQRFLPFREDRAVHLHAGNGPWTAYTAWLAQRHAAKGNTRRAIELLEHIARFGTSDGSLPEHVSTRERFVDFMQHEWETGLDFRKEFDPEILLPGVPFSSILEEAVRMRDAYAAAAGEAERAGDGIVRFASPLAWSHAEFAVALGMLADQKALPDASAARAAERA